MIHKVTVFGDSGCLEESKQYILGEKLGRALGAHNYTIVNGGYLGTMEAVFKGASEFNNERIAVTSKIFKKRVPNKYLTQIIETDNYVERLMKLVELGEAYIVLPGGTGTLAELATVWSLCERDLMMKPIITLGDQWREVVDTLAFYSVKVLDNLKYLHRLNNPAAAVDVLNDYFQQ